MPGGRGFRFDACIDYKNDDLQRRSSSEAFAALGKWEQDGRLVHRQTIFEGTESCVDALNGLFTGANIGKTLVKLGEPATA